MNPDPRAPAIPVTIVTTCMGRLDFLRRALPNWLAVTSFPVLVVDYSCPDGAGAWVEAAGLGPRVSVKHEAAEVREGRPVFNQSCARNAGAAAIDRGFLLFLDADTTLAASFQEWMLARLDPSAMFVTFPEEGVRYELGGALGVHVDAFRAVGGFDPGLQGWGTEDCEIKIRLYLQGLRFCEIPRGAIRAYPHSDELRTAHYLEKNMLASQAANHKYLNKKYLPATGRRYTRWFGDPEIRGHL